MTVMLSREDGEASQNTKVAESEILRFAQDDECVSLEAQIETISELEILRWRSG